MRALRRIAAGLIGSAALAFALVGAPALANAATAAGVGADPGTLTISPASGNITGTPTWSTSQACPTTGNGGGGLTSWQLDEYTVPASGSPAFVAVISSPFTGTGTPISGGLQNTVGSLLSQAGVTPSAPGSAEWTVACNYSGTGGPSFTASEFINISSGATTYTSSSTPPNDASTGSQAVSLSVGSVTSLVMSSSGFSLTGNAGSTATGSNPVTYQVSTNAGSGATVTVAAVSDFTAAGGASIPASTLSAIGHDSGVDSATVPFSITEPPGTVTTVTTSAPGTESASEVYSDGIPASSQAGSYSLVLDYLAVGNG